MIQKQIPVSEKKRDSRSHYIAGKIGSGLAVSTTYVIPFAAGFYVGAMDGNNIQMEPVSRYTLLTGPTAADVGLVTVLSSITKMIGRLSTNPEFRYEAMQRARLTPEQAAEASTSLEKLADISVTKQAAKALVKPGIMTTLGYVLGYSYSKLSK